MYTIVVDSAVKLQTECRQLVLDIFKEYLTVRVQPRPEVVISAATGRDTILLNGTRVIAASMDVEKATKLIRQWEQDTKREYGVKWVSPPPPGQ